LLALNSALQEIVTQTLIILIFGPILSWPPLFGGWIGDDKKLKIQNPQLSKPRPDQFCLRVY
jgi:hypothetical protein